MITNLIAEDTANDENLWSYLALSILITCAICAFFQELEASNLISNENKYDVHQSL